MIDSVPQPGLLTLTLVSGFSVGLALTYVFMRIMRGVGVVDVPNERSSHVHPTPRGGGLAIVVGFIGFAIANWWFDLAVVDERAARGLLLGGALVALIGAIDDVRDVSAGWRFLIHIFAATIALSLLQALPHIVILGFELSLHFGLFAILTLALVLVWLTNLFNFMDGIDGIAGVEAITTLVGAALILIVHGEQDWPVVFTFLAACTAGFLVWNWAPAKVFMGDACSGFLGFSLGFLAIATSTSDAINLWSWLILLGVFFIDATTTLLIRVSRGEAWYSAHRSHAYQILARRYGSHRKVTLAVLLVNLIWLLPLASLAASHPYWAFPICVGALLPLTLVAVKVGAGRSESSDS